ncbi:protein kinase [Streptomyces sp. NPDC006309]|uniref:serine/threonine-protein kinase n=1 Tax=Streptomyces sp. NPDC006309 TaxID=3156749 RepID=UPI0033BB19F4
MHPVRCWAKIVVRAVCVRPGGNRQAEMGDAAGHVVAGRYRLLSSLGAGGMGRVWRAHDQELDCEVVLKELSVPPGLPDPELSTRIARAHSEARHSARLRGNPHVVTVYDCVLHEGLPWIVMEYVPGARDLEAVVCEEGPVPRAAAAHMGRSLLDALAAGHRSRILHRDVKPSNVLVTSTDPHELGSAGSGRVLLTDYGISLREDAGEPRLTTVSGFVGTPGYLAPERARGEQPTPASDLFSLGATLYFAVEGHGPFDRGSPVGTLAALLTEEPVPPRRAGDLTPVLLGLLAKDPDRRLRSDAAADLLARLTGEGPRTQQATVTQVSRPPVKGSSPERGQRLEPRPDGPRVRKPGRPRRQRGSAERGSGGAKTRTFRRVIVATAAALAAGLVPWLVVTHLGATAKTPVSGASEHPSATGSVEPYGAAVGLSRELRRGDCVTARWTGTRFATEPPQLTLVDCANDTPDGQVVASDAAMSLADAQVNGHDRCVSEAMSTLSAMADAEVYSLSPSEQGWKSGVHDSVCLVFNRTSNIYGAVGAFRKTGDQIGPQNAETGDCYRATETKDAYYLYLARCDAAHDAQMAGFWKAPSGRSYSAEQSARTDDCTKKYGTSYDASTYQVETILPDENTWKQGFHYVMCIVDRSDSQKLTSPLTPTSQP